MSEYVFTVTRGLYIKDEDYSFYKDFYPRDSNKKELYKDSIIFEKLIQKINSNIYRYVFNSNCYYITIDLTEDEVFYLKLKYGDIFDYRNIYNKG